MREPNPFSRRTPDGASGGLLVERILTGRRKAAYVAGVSIWLAALAYFWVWWLRPDHVIGPACFVVISAILAWTTLMPLYFVIIFYKSVRPAGPLRVPSDTRVAMVVTKAPSEPFDVVADTLLCMLAQDYPHDTWLADEDPSPATLAWCREHGVEVSTRKGREDYHRLTWPRRTRCKEGNLAFFYDHYGYERYDIVCQLDADHAPSPGYLREMLRPFADPGVGYVSAPSICDGAMIPALMPSDTGSSTAKPRPWGGPPSAWMLMAASECALFPMAARSFTHGPTPELEVRVSTTVAPSARRSAVR